jgi:hypothetical protein
MLTDQVVRSVVVDPTLYFTFHHVLTVPVEESRYFVA